MTGPASGPGPPDPHSGSASESLRIRAFPGGPFQQNGYLVQCRATGRAAVVDPGATAPDIARVILEEGLEVDAVWLTHAHLDHVEGLPAIREVSTAPIFLHPADRFLYDRAGEQAAAFGYRLQGELPEPDRDIEPGSPLAVGDARLEVRFTPGHAPGHVILYHPGDGVALVGDVIFQRSIGRSDLPGGDFQQLMESIRREVLTLPDETRLLTGHGPETTVGEERLGNPFLLPHTRGGTGRYA
jgi:hydroxyacylglutathione hydrolase